MKTKIENPEYAVLVYQAGIANVFAVDCLNMRANGRTERRLIQSDFRTCETYCLGLAAAGIKVASAGCNMAGDIARLDWSSDLEAQPFYEKFRPVWNGVNPDFYFAQVERQTA